MGSPWREGARQEIEPLRGNMKDALESEGVYTGQQRIAELARRTPKMRMVSLNQYLNCEWLREAYRRTRKEAAAGVDGVTAEEYAETLDANIAELLEKAKSGQYVASPVRRVNIPKGGGKTRPLGIPTLEDKILQRAVVMLLEPIYEQDFLDCSYGFRPRRSPHMALQTLWRQIMNMSGCWLIDADITKFFDTMDKAILRRILDQRVGDGVVRRLIGKWLSAGVLEDGGLMYPEAGTPQGGVISPMLSNIYLHEVMDTWFEQTIRPRLQGRAFLVRFADDLVMGFELEEDARRVYKVLGKRFEKYGLAIQPEKTRLIPFFPPEKTGKRESFNFLGFTHHWCKSRKGNLCVVRKTMSKRLTQSLRSIGEYCRNNRTQPMTEQWAGLARRMRGHYAYYGITGNRRGLERYYLGVKRCWRYWLNRRSARRDMVWERFRRLLERYPLPTPKVVHSVYA